jgi:peptidoglycan/LPS O-acetylase OafA/YrhL
MTQPQLNYRPDIDGLRGLSVLLVLGFHGFPQLIPGGYIGVDIFFVISGYLITKQIENQIRQKSFSIKSFYARRIRRIFPPLIIVLIITGVFSYLRFSLDEFISFFEHVTAGTTFTSNFQLLKEAGYFDKQAELKPLLHLWSLGIEEQFYVIWPVLVMLLIAMESRSNHALFLGLAILCIVSFGLGAHLTTRYPVSAFYSPISRFWELGLGGLLAVYESMRVEYFARRRINDVFAVLGLCCIVACSLFLSKESKFPGFLALLPTTSALAVIAAGSESSINRRLLAHHNLVKLGLISFALYLWHWPILTFMRIEGFGSVVDTCLALCIAIVLAILTRFYVEKPIRYSAIQSTSTWLVIAFAVIGVAALLFSKGVFLPHRLMHQMQLKKANQFDVKGIDQKSCVSFTVQNSLANRFCTVWGDNESKHTIVVWGDSMSNAWMPPFLIMAREYDYRIVQFSHAGCPPIIGTHRTGESFAKEWCNDAKLQAEVFDAIKRVKPELVFLIARWNLYYHGHIKDDVLVEKSFITDVPGDATSLTAKIAFERGVKRTIELLSSFNKVVVFKYTPVLKVPLDIGLTRRPDSFEPSASEQQAFEAEINGIIDEVVTRTSMTVAFDPTSRLCNTNKCPSFVDGTPVYSDEVHITANASLLFLEDIKALIGVKK